MAYQPYMYTERLVCSMRILHYLKQFIINPRIRFGYISRLGLYNHISDVDYVKKEWKVMFGTELNLEAPKSFNEKLQWLKVYDHNDTYTMMVDKYKAKTYVASLIGKEYIIPTLGVWDSFDDIDFEQLPDKFVLKCTHDSGTVIICRNKSNLNKNDIKKNITKFLKRKYYYCHREWPYKNVQPRIIAEQFMQNGSDKELKDYKFYCFNGIPRYLYVSVGMDNHDTARISFLNIDWTFADFGRTDYRPLEQLPQKPNRYDEMIEIAKKLSKGIPFLRVDLYEINGQIYFGELTFSPCAGMMPFDPPEADLKMGKLLDISEIMNN